MWSLWEVLTPLLLASALGAAVGMERELHGRPAGLRTHILLSLGAALFGMLSRATAGTQGDPSRIAAQVVTGIGFIGAGTILHLGGTVRGLTTAASIWTTAAIGLAVGLDRRFWSMAILASLLAILTLALVHLLENRLRLKRRVRDMEVVVREGQSALEAVCDTLSFQRVEVLSIRQLPSLTAQTRHYEISMELPARLRASEVIGAILNHDSVLEAKWV